MAQQTVSDVMSPDPVTFIETERVAKAAEAMRTYDIGDVIVLDDNSGRVRGIVTDRDIVIRGMTDDHDPREITLGSICTTELVFIAPDESADKAVALMREKAIRRLPVVEDGYAVGVVSLGDLAERFDKRSALADISAASPNN